MFSYEKISALENNTTPVCSPMRRPNIELIYKLRIKKNTVFAHVYGANRASGGQRGQASLGQYTKVPARAPLEDNALKK